MISRVSQLALMLTVGISLSAPAVQAQQNPQQSPMQQGQGQQQNQGRQNQRPSQAPQAPSQQQAQAAARSVKNSRTSLQDGLAQAQSKGKPVSGQFESDNGKILLSIVTATSNGYSEVLLDPETGNVLKAVEITDPGDVNDATTQNTAMTQANQPLQSAADDAEHGNDGYIAVSIRPEMQDGHPVAHITLVRDDGTARTVIQKLD